MLWKHAGIATCPRAKKSDFFVKFDIHIYDTVIRNIIEIFKQKISKLAISWKESQNFIAHLLVYSKYFYNPSYAKHVKNSKNRDHL